MDMLQSFLAIIADPAMKLPLMLIAIAALIAGGWLISWHGGCEIERHHREAERRRRLAQAPRNHR